MCPDKKRPAGNTCRIAKGLDAVWVHFCPSKPCLPLSTDGIISEFHGFGKRGRVGRTGRSIDLLPDRGKQVCLKLVHSARPQNLALFLALWQ